MSEFSAYKAFHLLSADGISGTKLSRSLGKYANEWVYFGISDSVPGLYLFEPGLTEIGAAPNKNLSLSIENVNILGIPSGNYLKMSPTSPDFDLGLFSSICDEFIRISDTVVDGYEALTALLLRWSSLLKIANQTESTNALVGLYGELLCLDSFIKNKTPNFVEHWTGPDSARHDFEGPNWAFEVKTSTVLSERRAVIHGIGQLDAAPNTKLSLLHYQLEWAPGAESISELTIRIYEALSEGKKKTFIDKIAKLGFSLEKIGALAHVCLKVNSVSLYLVNDEFPRITRTTLGTATASITRVDYWLNLEGLDFLDVTDSFNSVIQIVDQ